MLNFKNGKKVPNNSIFSQILIFFTLLVFLSILITGSFSYFKSSSLLVEEVKNSTITGLNQITELVDSKLENLNFISQRIFLDENVSRVYYKSIRNPENYLMDKEIIHYLSSVKATDNFIEDIWIYFKRADYIVSTTSVYSKKIFYGSIMKQNDFLMDKIINTSHNQIQYVGQYNISGQNESKEVLIFNTSIKLDSNEPEATITFVINQKMIDRMIENLKIQYKHDVFLVDKQGDILLSNGILDETFFDNIKNELSKIKVDKPGYLQYDNQMVLYSPSSFTQWKYVSVISNRAVRKKSSIIKQFTIISSIIILLVALFFSYILTRRIYSPIQKMLSNITKITKKEIKFDDAKNEIFIINGIINFVYKENADLKKRMYRNAHEKYLDRLISGEMDFKNMEDSRTVRVSFPYKNYVVVIYDLCEILDSNGFANANGMLAVDFENELMKNVEKENFKHTEIHTIKKGASKYISIINFEDEPDQDQDLSGFIEATKYHMEQQFHQAITIGVGKTYLKADKLKESFMEALFALKHKLVKGVGSIIYVDEVYAFPQRLLNYPLDVETRLVNLTKSGEVNKTKEVLEEIIRYNMNEQQPDVQVIETMFYSLTGTAIRIILDIQCTIEEIMGKPCILYEELGKKETFQAKRDYIIHEVYMNIIKYINNHRKNKLEKVYNQIIEYIEKNYDSDVSLERIGEEAGLSISYLSVIFKEISGQKFVDYVNKFRISKAKALLINNDLTIKEIAEKVGYLNANTFINVFKKHEGITPGKYRH